MKFHKRQGDRSSFFVKILIKSELTTEFVNSLTLKIKRSKNLPTLLIGIGGGTVLDCTKAVSVLLTNRKKAEKYQGWDLLKNKGLEGKKLGDALKKERIKILKEKLLSN